MGGPADKSGLGLTFYHNGINRRLTDVHGHVVEEVLA
jgi:hypothetical protein